MAKEAAAERFVLEVAVTSVEGALAAARAGADRLELSAALAVGGLTPSLGLFEQIRRRVTLPVMVLVRPRPGDFVYGQNEISVMRRDLELFLEHGADGLVFGVLNQQGEIDGVCRKLLEMTTGKAQAIFHRAFDSLADQARGLETLIEMGFDRVLTSGNQATALAGAKRLRVLQQQARCRIEILPGGGITDVNVREIVAATGCAQVHGSFQRPAAGNAAFGAKERTSAALIRRVRRCLDRLVFPGHQPQKN